MLETHAVSDEPEDRVDAAFRKFLSLLRVRKRFMSSE